MTVQLIYSDKRKSCTVNSYLVTDAESLKAAYKGLLDYITEECIYIQPISSHSLRADGSIISATFAVTIQAS